jgi:hypothetical protein
MCSVRAVAFFLITIVLLVLLLVLLLLLLLRVIDVTDLTTLAAGDGSTFTGPLTFLAITDVPTTNGMLALVPQELLGNFCDGPVEREPLAREEGLVAVASLKADVSTITFTEEFRTSLYTAASLAGSWRRKSMVKSTLARTTLV